MGTGVGFGADDPEYPELILCGAGLGRGGSGESQS